MVVINNLVEEFEMSEPRLIVGFKFTSLASDNVLNPLGIEKLLRMLRDVYVKDGVYNITHNATVPATKSHKIAIVSSIKDAMPAWFLFGSSDFYEGTNDIIQDQMRNLYKEYFATCQVERIGTRAIESSKRFVDTILYSIPDYDGYILTHTVALEDGMKHPATSTEFIG